MPTVHLLYVPQRWRSGSYSNFGFCIHITLYSHCVNYGYIVWYRWGVNVHSLWDYLLSWCRTCWDSWSGCVLYAFLISMVKPFPMNRKTNPNPVCPLTLMSLGSPDKRVKWLPILPTISNTCCGKPRIGESLTVKRDTYLIGPTALVYKGLVLLYPSYRDCPSNCPRLMSSPLPFIAQCLG